MASKREVSLLKTIDSQKEQLSRYEIRMKDLVRAYKGLVKEKEALETSVNALTRSAPASDTDTAASSHAACSNNTDHTSSSASPSAAPDASSSSCSVSCSTSESLPAASVEPVAECDGAAAAAATKQESCSISAASNSDTAQPPPTDKVVVGEQLRRVTESLQVLIQQKSRQEASFVADRKNLRAELDKVQREYESCSRELSETRTNLLQLHQDRDADITNHKAMIEEMQQLLQTARAETAELHETCGSLSEQLGCFTADSVVNTRLQQALDDLKLREHQLSQTAEDRERRVAVLESQLSQLSSSVGVYQQEMSTMRTKIAQLQEQLARAQCSEASFSHLPTAPQHIATSDEKTSATNHNDCNDCDDGLLEADQLINQLVDSARQLINSADFSCEQLAPVRELLMEYDGVDWKREYEQLNKSELNQHNNNNNNNISNNSSTGPLTQQNTRCGVSEDNVELPVCLQCHQLSAKLEFATREHAESLHSLQHQLDSLRQKLTESQAAHTAEISSLTAAHSSQLSAASRQLSSYQLLSSSQLQEKEAELFELKQQLKQAASTADHLAPIVSSNLQPDTYILHYSQELSRREVEVSQLRRHKRQLEFSLRQLQDKMISLQQTADEQTHFLNDKIQRLELNVSRESASLEYIKNIVVRYLTTADYSQRQHIITAIATALRFTRDELQRARRSAT